MPPASTRWADEREYLHLDALLLTDVEPFFRDEFLSLNPEWITNDLRALAERCAALRQCEPVIGLAPDDLADQFAACRDVSGGFSPCRSLTSVYHSVPLPVRFCKCPAQSLRDFSAEEHEWEKHVHLISQAEPTRSNHALDLASAHPLLL